MSAIGPAAQELLQRFGRWLSERQTIKRTFPDRQQAVQFRARLVVSRADQQRLHITSGTQIKFNSGGDPMLIVVDGPLE